MNRAFDDKNRFRVLIVLIVLIGAALFARLFYLQVVKGESYYEQSQKRISSVFAKKAPRGEIVDKYGRPLVTNRLGYSLKLQKSDVSGQEMNKMLLEVIGILEECGYTYEDSLPITVEKPYKFRFSDENGNGLTDDEKKKWFSGKKKISADMTPEEIVNYYKNSVYNIGSDYTDDEARKIVGIRYDISMSGFSAVSPFSVAEDIDINVITKIKERVSDFEGLYISKEYFRNYNEGTLASHILGGIGKISGEEYAEKKDEGYGMNDLVGKRGVEKLFEPYLKGKDGVQSNDSNIEDIPEEAGDYVVLTIDSELQKTVENSLQERIHEIAARGANLRGNKGADANAGAAVVLDVKSGAALAIASYPTYDPERFNKDYSELLENEAKPMWNRAISGGYAPGSTFKPLVAIAALESGKVTINEKIRCDGIYKYYKDYQPKCWIWSDSGKTHGDLNVSQAIEFSCNCYFYEAGRRTGIDEINKYAKLFGLGDVTGIGFPEESKGNISNPEYKASIGKTEEDKKWYPADTIITAIGQSYSYFTPIQLANYVATIANGGTLYKTHILKSIRSSTDGSLVYENEPTVMGTVAVDDDIMAAVKKGMYGVVDEGSASAIFADYPIHIGGKTGTAQTSRKVSDNALFVAFAPFENPEIAVAVVLEHGVKGANAAYVAKDIFDEYFRNDVQVGIVDIEGELLP